MQDAAHQRLALRIREERRDLLVEVVLLQKKNDGVDRHRAEAADHAREAECQTANEVAEVQPLEQNAHVVELLVDKPGATLVRQPQQILLVHRRCGHDVTDVADHKIYYQPRQQEQGEDGHAETQAAGQRPPADSEAAAHRRQRVDQMPEEHSDHERQQNRPADHHEVGDERGQTSRSGVDQEIHRQAVGRR